MDPNATAVASGRYGDIEGLVEDRVVFGHYREHGDWSPAVLDLVCDRLRPATVIDVGANIGLFSIPVAQRTDAHCLAFEPEPTNYSLLERNLAHHGLTQRVRTRRVAVYSRACTLNMRLSTHNSGDHHVAGPADDEDAAANADLVDAQADTLDSLLAGETLPSPILLKIDTQGCELQVLRGAARLLPRVEHCIVEYWPAGLARLGDRPAGLRAALSIFPYAALLDQHDSQPELVPTELLWKRLAFLADDDQGFFDLLLSRNA